MTSVLRKCAGCGARNRVPTRFLAKAGRCGSCKAQLDALGEPLDVDVETFDAIVAESPVPVLVDFWAEWCGPCKMAGPEVRELAREMSGKALVLKVDTEAHPQLAARYSVQSIPNFVVFRDGRVAMQKAGLAPRSEMARWLAPPAPAYR